MKQFWILFVMTFLVNMTIIAMAPIINVTSAHPATYIFVDPQEVRYPGEYFYISINVSDAPTTYTWEIYISWDPTLLELVQMWDPYWAITVDVMEGSFLDRRYWDDFWKEWVKNCTTSFGYFPSRAEANVKGEIRVGCSLLGQYPWASGDGWLCTLRFHVKTMGSCVLDLFDTRLWDYELAGSPAYTYYPNLDGFFYNTLFHDVAITNVAAQPATLYVNQSATVDVTIRNEGNYTETSATFNVTAYADTNPYEYIYDAMGRLIKTNVVIGDEITIGTKTVTTSLPVGATRTLTFTWNTTGLREGTYTISAVVMGDDDTRDNIFIDSTVYARRIRGDVNGDGRVDNADLTAFAQTYGCTPTSGNWNPDCDFNGNEIIEVLDLFTLSKNYTKTVGA